MMMNQHDIEWAASQRHECPNVRKGVRLLLRLMQAVNAQSDGWAYWSAPSKASEKLQALLKTAGNLHYGTHGTITDEELKKAVAPIRSMVTRQKRIQARYGNTFEFDVDAALQESSPWDQLSLSFKLSILAGESTVMAPLLAENQTLMRMLRNGEGMESCLSFIHQNW